MIETPFAEAKKWSHEFLSEPRGFGDRNRFWCKKISFCWSRGSIDFIASFAPNKARRSSPLGQRIEESLRLVSYYPRQTKVVKSQDGGLTSIEKSRGCSWKDATA